GLPDPTAIVRDAREGLVEVERVVDLERQLSEARAETTAVNVTLSDATWLTREAAVKLFDDLALALGPSEPPADIPALVRQEVAGAVAALPPAQDGRSVSAEDCRPLIEEAAQRLVSEAMRAIPPAKDGMGFTDAVIDRNGALVLTKSDGGTVDLGRVVGRDGAPGERGEKGDAGKDGRDGVDGA